ncbi:MAG TPA: AMP-dependent synthetase, partial [Arthrobacter bacterium]|nr:AMP-dependent synthetase [Arthrobacter sp.]
MPFLDKIQRWAEERPHDTAVVVAGRRLRWAELRDAATAAVPTAAAVTVLAEANSVDFAVKFAAAVAGERQCAVLDPTWPAALHQEILHRLG